MSKNRGLAGIAGIDLATQVELDDALALKADQSTTYTKTEVDAALGSIESTLATFNKTFTLNEEATYPLSNTQTAPIVEVWKEIPASVETDNTWNVNVGEYEQSGSDLVIADGSIELYLTVLQNDSYTIAGTTYDSVSFSVGSQDTAPFGMTFNNDGTKMYVVGTTNDRIYQYTLSTAWNLSTASYDSVSLGVNAQDTTPYGMNFNNDGTKMYMVGNTNKSIYQYTLSTAWNLSTATYDNVSFSVNSQDTQPRGVVFNNDGTKMYIMGYANDKVYQYTLGTAFNVSTASYDSINFSVTSQDTIPFGVAFNNDGTKMYIMGYNSTTVYQYTLSNGWNLSTASYDSIGFSVNAQSNSPYSLAFNNDGSKMYIVGASTSTVYQYSTNDSFFTATYPSTTHIPAVTTLSGQIDTQLWQTIDDFTKSETLPSGTKINYAVSTDGRTSWKISNTDGERTIARNNGGTWEYNTNTTYSGETWVSATDEYDALSSALSSALVISGGYNLEAASYDSVSFYVGGQDGTPNGLTFSSDGSKMYIVGSGNDSVYQYTLSTAFNISTASYDSISFSVSAQETSPYAIAFNNDGTKMFMVGFGSDSVYQYSLSTAWNVGTASYNSVSFSVASQDTTPVGLTFNNDGTKMYITGNDNDSIYQYTLSTAFDLSTASYDSISFSVNSQETAPIELTFNSDGTKMYILGYSSKSVYQYTLSTAFDLSTASYDNMSFSIVSQETSPRGLKFNNDGTKMYMVGTDSYSVSQYTTVGYASANSLNTLPPTTLGDTLDLATILYTDDNTATPTFSGLSIDYRSFSTWKKATTLEYEATTVTGDSVTIKALSANTLKGRVL